MAGTRTLQGFEVRLRPAGFGRFVASVPMLVWLGAWAVGELGALWLLGTGALSIATGEPAFGDRIHEPGPALAMAGFLVVWLAVWTLGGTVAIRELLRMLWAEDVIVANPAALDVSNRLGPFHWASEIPRDRLQRVFVQPGTKALVAQTASGIKELSTLGYPADREAAAQALAAELSLVEEEDPRARVELPEGWERTRAPDGATVLISDPVRRRKQSTFATVITLCAATIAMLLVRDALTRPGLVVAAAIATCITVALGWATIWLSRGRMEWCLEQGRLRLRRRFGDGVREVHEARAVELTVAVDGDGDEWFELYTVPVEATHEVERRRRRERRRRITHAVNEPEGPRQLGHWLAQNAAIRFFDRVTVVRKRIAV